MKTVKQFFDVSDFVTTDSGFGLKRHDKNIVLVNSTLDEIFSIELKESVQEICYSGGAVFTNTLLDGNGVIVHNDGRAEYKDFFIKQIFEGGDILGTDNESAFKFNSKGNKEWVVGDIFFHFYATREYVFYKNGRDLVICLDNKNGQTFWSYKLPLIEVCYDGNPVQDVSISRILGLYKETIWIVLNIGDILGVSVDDGLLKYHLKLPANWPVEWKAFEYFGNAQKSVLDASNGKIFGISNTLFWEIDLELPEESYTYYDISSTCNKHTINATLVNGPVSWQGDEIFTGQQEFAQQPSFVGLFNRKTREYTWTSHEMGEAGVFPGLRKVGISGNNLFVLDASGKLHILVRE